MHHHAVLHHHYDPSLFWPVLLFDLLAIVVLVAGRRTWERGRPAPEPLPLPAPPPPVVTPDEIRAVAVRPEGPLVIAIGPHFVRWGATLLPWGDIASAGPEGGHLVLRSGGYAYRLAPKQLHPQAWPLLADAFRVGLERARTLAPVDPEAIDALSRLRDR